MTHCDREIGRIHPGELTGGNLLFLDVRTPAEFAEAHIEGALLLPLHELTSARVQELAAGRDGCILVCRSGGRAAQAAEKLRGADLPGLSVLEGGVAAWEAAGQPLVRGRKAMSLERQVRIAAGSLVLAGVALSLLVHPAWIGLSGFVGAGLVFAGITDTCGMGMLLARMPWNRR